MILPDVDIYIDEIDRLNRELEQERQENFRLERLTDYYKTIYEALLAKQPQTKMGTCERCGREMSIKAHVRARRFCSDACRQSHYREAKQIKEIEERCFKRHERTLLSQIQL